MSCNYDENLLNYNYGDSIPENSLIPLQDQFQKTHIIKVCYKIDYFMNFVYLNQQQQQQKNFSSYDCQYNGLSFQLNQKTQKCPISDIKFSKENQIENYEKIAIENNDNYNFFIKRNDNNSTPLVGLFLQKDELKGLRKTDLIFDSVSLCKFDQYTLLCEQYQLELAQYSLQLENQIPYTPFCSLNYEEFSSQKEDFHILIYILTQLIFFIFLTILCLDNNFKDIYAVQALLNYGLFIIIFMTVYNYYYYNYLSRYLNSIGWSCLLESPLKSELQWIESYVSCIEIIIALQFCLFVICFVAIKLIEKA
ncbi:transmembrane protein, putative (macronuclear) [Tetrahymena thermophila SB210]|uniref:Transmembrane protein, putative n=1 Tax=Tetrahymena thermophila (strain SB210) TaxID=312017 RepID=I7LXS1_TETTS|nr:transmembrane protein, putative [Tetrahymena thermophila SB210]EAS06083.1 transmembrane protein, putative [Tetrahymena thermophila SB210]|eukprot:XP_001026328.1 transmembrane protein, putative [Tetrahymena thermophila SB210]